MKIINLILFTFILSTISTVSSADRIYRFNDKDGISTLSKSLPPYAAQQGYDILDSKSLRLIKRVYTRKELNRIQKKQQFAQQKENAKRQQEEKEKQRLIEQGISDRNLLARYPTENVFIKSRDEDIQYHQRQIDSLKISLNDNRKRLISLQAKAAEAEINGDTVSDDLHTKLLSTEQQIQHNKQLLDQAISEKIKVTKQYEADYTHLQKLLHLPEK